MGEFDTLFRQRIGIPETETIPFEKLDLVLEKSSAGYPF